MQWAPPHGGALLCQDWFPVTFGDLRSVATQANLIESKLAERSAGPLLSGKDWRGLA